MVASPAFESRNEFPNFDIRNFIDQLEPAKEKGKYICPNCNHSNLTWDNSEPPKFTCWNGCDRREIKEAIKPWIEVLAERQGNNYTRSPIEKKTKGKQPSKPKPALIPDKELVLIMLTEPATDVPQPEKLRGKPLKGLPGSTTETIYIYSKVQWVVRYQWPDAEKEKGYSKTFRQCHRLPDGTPEMRKGDKPWGAYRMDEAITAAKSVNGAPVSLQLEGEKCVEIARLNGICAITFQGSSCDKKSIVPEYKRALEGGIEVIVYLHDNDATGLKKAATCAEYAAEAGIAFIAINPLSICPDLESKGDIEQILAQMETPEFIRRLEQEIHTAVKERSEQLAEEKYQEREEELLNNLFLRPKDPILNFNQKAFEALFG